MRALLISLAIALAAPAVSAQPRDAPQPAPAAQRREEIKRKIRTLRAYAVTTELDLDEQTGARLWPILAKYDDEIDKLLQQRIDVQRRLANARQLRDPKAQDKLIDDALANQRGFWSVEERRLAELRRILTPGQTTRLLVVLPGFERKIQRQLRRAMVRPAHGGDFADDEDADDMRDEDAAPRPPQRPRGRWR